MLGNFTKYGVFSVNYTEHKVLVCTKIGPVISNL
jgi:hypothetical protein